MEYATLSEPNIETNPLATKGERLATATAKIFRENGRIWNYYQPEKNLADKFGELDALGVDLVLFLMDTFCLPLQFKSSSGALPTHYLNYPYISARVIREGNTTKFIGEYFETLLRNAAQSFFTKESCVPEFLPIENGAKKNILLEESRLRSALMRRSPLIAHYHRAFRGQEIEQRLGFTGLVFLRNGLGLFLRRQRSGLPAPFASAFPLPKESRPKYDAEQIVDFIERQGRLLSF